jgi:lysozyme
MMLKITASQETSLKWDWALQASEQIPAHVIRCPMRKSSGEILPAGSKDKDAIGKTLTIDRAVLAPDKKHAQVFFNPPANIKLNGIVTVWPSGYLFIAHWPALISMFEAEIKGAPKMVGNAAIWDESALDWKGWLSAYAKAMSGGPANSTAQPVAAAAVASVAKAGGGSRRFKPQELRLNSIAIAMIKSFEGLELKQYTCSAGVSSIGLGTTRFFDGGPIPAGATITEAQAIELFQRDIEEFISALRSLIDRPITARQAAALTSWIYNCGIGALEESTLLKVINGGGSDAEIQAQFRRWTNGGLAGLVSRREAECELWVGGKWEKHR